MMKGFDQWVTRDDRDADEADEVYSHVARLERENQALRRLIGHLVRVLVPEPSEKP